MRPGLVVGAVAIVAAAVSTVGLAARAGTTESTPLTSLEPVVVATRAAGSGRFALTNEVVRYGDDVGFRVRGTGSFDRGRRFMTELTYGNVALTGEAELEVRTVRTGDVVYVGRTDVFPWSLPPGADWAIIKARDDQLDDLGMIAELVLFDPREVLDLLAATRGPLERLGQAELRGSKTTHYRARLDVGQLVAMSPGEPFDPTSPAALLPFLSARTGVPVDVWVDERNRLRRIALAVQSDDTGTTLAVHLVQEFFDYEDSISIDVPDHAAIPERLDSGEYTLRFTTGTCTATVSGPGGSITTDC